MLAPVMFCPDCKHNLDDVPVGDPCPGCGGDRRSAIAMPETIHTRVSIGEVSLRVTKGDARPWIEKWRRVLQCLTDIDDAYSVRSGRLGNDEVDRRVETFCVECNHLWDWLTNDVGNLPGVSAADIKSHWDQPGTLGICNAMCNSHTRNRGITARIRSTSITPTGARVTIEVDWASPSATTVDALDLANECVASWRSFFAAKGIPEP
jgi:hypothetical protein